MNYFDACDQRNVLLGNIIFQYANVAALFSLYNMRVYRFSQQSYHAAIYRFLSEYRCIRVVWRAKIQSLTETGLLWRQSLSLKKYCKTKISLHHLHNNLHKWLHRYLLGRVYEWTNYNYGILYVLFINKNIYIEKRVIVSMIK